MSEAKVNDACLHESRIPIWCTAAGHLPVGHLPGTNAPCKHGQRGDHLFWACRACGEVVQVDEPRRKAP